MGDDLASQLRAEIGRAGKSRYQLCQETGVSQTVLSRFVHGRGGLSLKSAGLLCENLGLRLMRVTAPPVKQGGITTLAVKHIAALAVKHITTPAVKYVPAVKHGAAPAVTRPLTRAVEIEQRYGGALTLPITPQ